MDMSPPAFPPLPNSDEKVNRDHLHQAIPDNSNQTFTNDKTALPCPSAIQRAGLYSDGILIGSKPKNFGLGFHIVEQASTIWFPFGINKKLQCQAKKALRKQNTFTFISFPGEKS